MHTWRRMSWGDRIFHAINYALFLLLGVIMLLPFWHVLMQSLSSYEQVQVSDLFLYPRGLTLATYVSVFRNPLMFSGFATSGLVTVTSTLLGTLITALMAYGLSKRSMFGGKALMLVVLITMVFNGGLIPNYLLIKNLGLIDNRLALILPGLMSAYNVIIMRSFFSALPEALSESAKLDGANDLTIFFRIVLPLSGAMLATVALFIAVGYWNDYMSSVLYINTNTKWSLQTVLRHMLTNTSSAMSQAGVSVAMTQNVSVITIRAGSIIVATIPILIIYPFLQKYFVKGVLIGGIKG